MAEKDTRPDGERDDEGLDNDEDLDDDEGDGQDEGDEGDEGDDDYTPPTREEWEKVRGTIRRRKEERDAARAELAKIRSAARGKERERASKDAGGKAADAGDDGRDDESAKWRQSAARSSAATQLTAAGFSGTAKQAKRLTRLLDLDGSEPDRDGDFDFEDEIDELKDEYPQLFRSADDSGAARSRTRRPTTADRGRDEGKGATGDPTARTSRALLRQARVRR